VKPSENKWLLVRAGAILTPSINPVIVALDEWYRQYQCRSYVTSGLRDPKSQFRIIQQAAITRGLTKEFPKIIGANIDSVMINRTQTVPIWLPVWSRLLTIGFLVNPPVAACVLFDYVHPKSGKKILAGTLIQPSPHFKGTAFDIGGRGESQDQTIDDELEILKLAFDSGTIPDLLAYTVERDNNALHCDCKKVG
jgi:hypothetical protein